MSVFISLLPVLLATGLSMGVVRIAARLFRRTQLRWTHAFVFSLFLMIFGFVKTLATHQGLMAGTPPLLEFFLGSAILLTFGAWYFGAKARSPSGEQLGWSGGLKLTGLIFAILLLMAFSILKFLVPLLASPS